MIYYNTTNEKGNELKEFNFKAKTQDEWILTIFKNTKKSYSASELLKLSGLNCPITSIRRSLSTLKNKNVLLKEDAKVMGLYGRKEYKYKLA